MACLLQLFTGFPSRRWPWYLIQNCFEERERVAGVAHQFLVDRAEGRSPGSNNGINAEAKLTEQIPDDRYVYPAGFLW